MRKFQSARLMVIIFISALFTLFILNTAQASENFFTRNNILFYDPNDFLESSDGTLCSDIGSVASFGDLKLTEQGIKWLQANGPTYKQKLTEKVYDGKTRQELYTKAALQLGLAPESWMFLATIDNHERGFRTNVSILNGYDPFNTSSQNATDGVASGKNYYDDLVIGLSHFKRHSDRTNLDLTDKSTWTVDNVGESLLRYNRGTLYDKAGLTWQDSGHVNNFSQNYANNGKLDHQDYCKVTATMGANYRCNHNNSRVGQIHVFNYLNNGFAINQSSGSSDDFKQTINNCTSAGAGSAESLMEVFQTYAYTEYYKPGTVQAGNPKNRAYLTDPILREYAGGLSRPGQDCGAWVRFVMIKSGWDPNYGNINGAKSGQTAHIKRYLDNKSNGWEIIATNPTNPNVLQPGDVALCTGHTYMYLGNGVFTSASLQERFPMRGSFQECSGRQTNWYRKVN